MQDYSRVVRDVYSAGVDTRTHAYQLGIAEFNRGAYWEAHHHWEQEWRKLPTPDQEHIQALILACGTFVHLSKSKWGPALSLCKLALERFSQVEILGLDCQIARIQAPGLLEILGRIRELLESEGQVPAQTLQEISLLRVRWEAEEGAVAPRERGSE